MDEKKSIMYDIIFFVSVILIFLVLLFSVIHFGSKFFKETKTALKKVSKKSFQFKEKKYNKKYNSVKKIDPIYKLQKLGYKEYQNKNYRKSISYFNQIIAIKETDAYSHTLLSYCYYYTKDRKKMFYHAKRSLQIDPNQKKLKNWINLQ